MSSSRRAIWSRRRRPCNPSMIRGELRLVAASVADERARHDHGVVYQDVQRSPGSQKANCEIIDRPGTCQVERCELRIGRGLASGGTR